MSNNNLARWLIKVTVAGLVVVATMPAVAQAQNQAPLRGLWMAASSNQASLSGNTWGRLRLVDGVLAFQSSNFEWQLALSEIKHIAVSKNLSNALEVESVTGQVFFVGILDGQMTMTSPGKAVQMIQRAVRTAPASSPVRATMVAGGSLR